MTTGIVGVIGDFTGVMEDNGLTFLTIPNTMIPSNAQNYFWNYNVEVVEGLSDINQSTIKRHKSIINILIYKRVKGSSEMTSYQELLVLCEDISKDIETTTNWTSGAILNLYLEIQE